VLRQIEEGLKIGVVKAGISYSDVVAVGLDTPAGDRAGVLSASSTNFAHPQWIGFDIRGGLEKTLASQ